MKDFAGKVLFITGGASGVGFGQAKVFSEAGCRVVIADYRQDHIDEAIAYFRGKNAEVHAIKVDITDRQAYIAAADEVEEVYGSPPQLLFNTAGVNTFGPAEASTFEDYDWVLGIDLFGVINGLVIFVPRMIKAGKGGHIVTTSSMAGFMGGPTVAPYSAAKAAVQSLTESYYTSLKPYNIGVSCLCPGGVATNIHEATYMRPEHLRNTGYLVNEDTIDFEGRFNATGIDPVELAEILKKGIEDEIVYILPFPDPVKVIEEHVAHLANYTSPEGIKRQEELTGQRRAEIMKRMADDDPRRGADKAGWGKARADLTWIREH